MVSLNRGQYSGNVVNIRYLKSLTVGMTSYSDNNYASSMHCHENPHISYFLEGGHEEKRAQQSFERIPGDVLFCYGGEPHQFITKKFPSKNINIELDYEFLKTYGISENTVSDAIRRSSDTKFLLLKVYRELLVNDDLSETSIQILILSLSREFRRVSKSFNPQWLQLLIEIIHAKWNEYPTLHELSEMTQVHPVTISKYFTKYFACTLGEYMRKLKINKSLELIKGDNMSLTEIAFECGFSDQSHFIRTFKQITGWLPRAYRRL